MVDFRYHLVSLIAVFLALGIGLVLGTTALPQPLIDDLNRNVRRLSRERDERGDRIRALEARIDDDREFAQALLPAVVNDRLDGRHVVVVMSDGASEDLRDAVVDALDESGAQVTGRVRLTAALSDPARAGELDDLVDALLPAGVELRGNTAVERAASELAAVIGTRAVGEAQPSTPSAAATRVLAGLAENGFVAVDGQVTAFLPAPLVVVVMPPARRAPSPAPSPGNAPDPAVALVAALAQRADGVVAAAAGEGDEPGSPLAAVRADARIADVTSTVDGVDTAQGQIALVLALAGEVAGQQGHYGTGPGAEAPVPSPAARE